jgi:Leucine-rich repeat (LRR) protein
MQIRGTFRESCNNYTYYIKSAQIKSPGTEIKEIIGDHKRGKCNEDVKEIVYNRKIALDYYPRGLQKIFPNLISLTVNDCGLKSIARRDLEGFKNLVELDLSYNELTMLPDDLFEDMKKLKIIFLCENKLELLSSKLIRPILENGLEIVDFRGNGNLNTCFWVSTAVRFVGDSSLEDLMDKVDANCLPPPKNEKINQLWEKSRFSDFVIKVGSKQFDVHRIILGLQSPVFAAMFEKEMKEKRSDEIKIVEFSAEAVDDFLHYLYTGEVKEVNAMELFGLASKYDVMSLKHNTEEIVLKNINEKNAIEVFELGQLYGSKLMKKTACEEIKKTFKELDKLDESLINNPGKLKMIVEAKQKREQTIKNAEKKFEMRMKQYKKNK